MADVAVGIDVGADADEGAEVGAGIERSVEVEGGDTIEEHGEVELVANVNQALGLTLTLRTSLPLTS